MTGPLTALITFAALLLLVVALFRALPAIDAFAGKVFDYIIHSLGDDSELNPNHYDQIPQSSVAGVAFDTEKQLWRVRFRVDGFRKHFGYFETQKDAEARCLAERNSLLNSGSSIASCKE